MVRPRTPPDAGLRGVLLTAAHSWLPVAEHYVVAGALGADEWLEDARAAIQALEAGDPIMVAGFQLADALYTLGATPDEVDVVERTSTWTVHPDNTYTPARSTT